MTPRFKAELNLALMCVIWGSTFSLVRESLDGTDPWLFLTLRFGLAIPACLLLFGRHIDLGDQTTRRRGLWLGAVLFLAFLTQTLGLQSITASRSGFLTALYIVMVPLLLAGWERRRPSLRTLSAALVSLGGVTLLSGLGTGGQRLDLGLGEALTILCAALFALQIILADRLPVAGRVWTLHFWQIATVAALSAAGWLLLGEARWRPDAQLAVSLFINSVFGTVVALGLQLRYQPQTTPERAALVYSFEPVFAALMALLILGERLGPLEWAGGGLILLALRLADPGPVETRPGPV
ncbi:MAG: DMT family transporter [bacterium]|nr:DMT family transporter [bacterium]